MTGRAALPVDDAPIFHVPRRLSVRRIAERLAAAGYAVADGHAVRVEDAFLDTQDGALHRRGLRLRRRSRPSEWHVLERGWLVAWSPAAAPDAPEEGLPAEMTREAAPDQPLVLQAVVRTTGRSLPVRSPVGAELELVVGRWTFATADGELVVPGPRVALLESPSDAPAEAEHLEAVLRDLVGLRRVGDDPLRAALSALELPLPGAPVPPELRLAAGDTMAEVARKTLGRQAYKMWANAAGTAADLDPEFLHDLRVATRRARAALRLFVAAYGEERCAALRGELAWIADRLGAVRDLDVHLERVRHDLSRAGRAAGGDAGLTERLRARREPALAELRRALRSPRFAALLAALRAAEPAEGAGDEGGFAATPAVEVAPALIAKAARRVRRWGEHADSRAPEPELHRLRILFKRLRYTCEFFADLYGDEFREAVARLVPFQDCLGALQDAVVATATIAGHAGEVAASPQPSPAGLLTLGALLQVQREEIARQRARLARLWRGLPALARALRRPDSKVSDARG